MWYTEFTVAAVLVVLTGLIASAASRRLRHVPNPKGLPGRGLPLLDTAFLAGGPERVADTVIVRMQYEGRLIISRDRLVTVTDGRPQDDMESVLIGEAGPSRQGALSALRGKVMCSEHVQRIGDRLADRGLMRRPDLYRKAVVTRRLLRLAVLVAVVLGVVTTVSWSSRSWSERDTNTPPFFAFLGLLLLGVAWLAASKPGKGRITPAGVRQLQLMEQGAPWRPADGGAEESALLLGAVALKGVRAVDDDELRAALSAEAEVRVGASSGSGLFASSGVGSGAAVVWCASSSWSSTGASCGSSGSSCGSSGHSSGHGSGHSCGSGHSSGHSCGSSGHSCGSSSCGSSSSCGGGSSCGS